MKSILIVAFSENEGNEGATIVDAIGGGSYDGISVESIREAIKILNEDDIYGVVIDYHQLFEVNELSKIARTCKAKAIPVVLRVLERIDLIASHDSSVLSFAGLDIYKVVGNGWGPAIRKLGVI